MSQYEAAWAYLQGALEALTPLVMDLPATKLQERLTEVIAVGRGMSAMVQMPIPESSEDIDRQNAELLRGLREVPNPGKVLEDAAAASGSVFFPHDLQRAGNGTFTPPEPTEEEIEELLRRRNGG